MVTILGCVFACLFIIVLFIAIFDLQVACACLLATALVAIYPTSEGRHKMTCWAASFRIGCYVRDSRFTGNFRRSKGEWCTACHMSWLKWKGVFTPAPVQYLNWPLQRPLQRPLQLARPRCVTNLDTQAPWHWDQALSNNHYLNMFSNRFKK